jgi:hypothetical protein
LLFQLPGWLSRTRRRLTGWLITCAAVSGFLRLLCVRLARQQTAPYAFGPACTGPHSGNLLDSHTTFSTRASRTTGGFPFGLSNVIYDLLRNPLVNTSRAVDTCGTVECNPTCIDSR